MLSEDYGAHKILIDAQLNSWRRTFAESKDSHGYSSHLHKEAATADQCYPLPVSTSLQKSQVTSFILSRYNAIHNDSCSCS